MEFLREIFGEELFKQIEEKINAHNGNEANKDKQIKLANLGSGEYVGKGKYDSDIEKLRALITSKDTELTTANNLISELKQGTAGNAELQNKITGYETQVAELQQRIAESDWRYAFEVLLMDAGVQDKEAREFLMFKYEKKLKKDGKGFELDENKHIRDADNIVDGFKTSNPTMFNAGKGEKKILGDNKLPNNNNGQGTVTKEQFAKMGYKERLKLKEENEEMFKKLATNN